LNLILEVAVVGGFIRCFHVDVDEIFFRNFQRYSAFLRSSCPGSPSHPAR
jgi:hypothetical protein